MRIILIDDEPIVLMALSRLLNYLGHSVTCINSGDDLDAVVGENTADLVITDLLLPGLSGVELIRRLHGLLPGTPVVVISGHGEGLVSLQDVDDIDVHAYLLKPFGLDELESLLMRLLENRGEARGDIDPDVESLGLGSLG